MINLALTSSLRHFKKEKGYSLINLLGLTTGICCCLLIYLYIASEQQYDKAWSNSDNIFRVSQTQNTSGVESKYAVCGYGVGPALVHQFPEVTQYTRLLYQNNALPIDYNGKIIDQKGITHADSTFFEIFDYPMLSGNRHTCLTEPNSVVLSRPLAKKIFGRTDISGESLKIQDKNFKITGVFDPSNHPSHLDAQALMSMTTVSDSMRKVYADTWVWLRTYTYVRLNTPESSYTVLQKIPQWIKNHIQPWLDINQHNTTIGFLLTPIKQVHFTTNLPFDKETNINQKKLHLFGFTGLFVLLIGCINYINLTTAHSSKRAREVGVRKVLGANRQTLIYHYLTESFIITFIAMLIALTILEFILPWFNNFTGKHIILSHYFIGKYSFRFWGILIMGTLLTALLSGFVPAFLLSGFQPNAVLKGYAFTRQNSGGNRNTGTILRNILVIMQFIISTSMIICTTFIFLQMNYIHKKQLGFEKENIMVIEFPRDRTLLRQIPTFKTILKQHPGINCIAATRNLPSYTPGSLIFYYDEENGQAQKTMNLYMVDEDFDNLLNIHPIAGRFFSNEFKTDQEHSIILNQAACKALGWENPLNKKIASYYNEEGVVIGVIPNFNYTSLHNPIDPLVLINKPQFANKLAFKINPEKYNETRSFVAQQWETIAPGRPLKLSSLQQRINHQYSSEKQAMVLFRLFSLIIIIISCLGLLGLASYVATQKRKELGIRKVFGASTLTLMLSLQQTFILRVLTGSLLAWPLSWYLINQWFARFEYHIAFRFDIFIYSTLLTITIALLTIGYQAYRAANTNPVKSLRYE